jgi:hypothetical protein
LLKAWACKSAANRDPMNPIPTFSMNVRPLDGPAAAGRFRRFSHADKVCHCRRRGAIVGNVISGIATDNIAVAKVEGTPTTPCFPSTAVSAAATAETTA